MTTKFSDEQNLAINGDNGLLVSAGAGSGKTAVLIERIIVTIRRKIQQYKNVDYEKVLASIVVVTFTVKAAQEMKFRLNQRLSDEELLQDNAINWLMVKKLLGRLFIGTLDSYFLSLVQEHHDKSPFAVAFSVLSPRELHSKIRLILRSTIKEADPNLQELYWRHESSWIDQFEEMLEDPAARLFWEKYFFAQNKNGVFIDEKIFMAQLRQRDQEKLVEILDKAGYSKLKQDHVVKLQEYATLVNSYYANKKNKVANWFLWFEAVKNFSTETSLDSWYRVFASHGNIIAPRAEELSDVSSFISDWKNFWKNVEEIYHDSQWMMSDESTLCYQYAKLFHYLHSKFESKYLSLSGYSFSDVPYYLNKEKILQSVKLDDPSFIIDEFQDTSFFQWNLLWQLAKQDPSRFFIVGDIKQSIYGFRGGEVDVFQQVAAILPHKIIFRDNYRSIPELVKFNNLLFNQLYLFSQSLHQESKYVDNKISLTSEKAEIHPVKIIKYILSDEEQKTKTEYKELVEYTLIINEIKKIRETFPEDSIAILLKTNDQIRKVATLLLEQKLSFEAQLNLSWEMDDLFQLFYWLVCAVIEFEQGKVISKEVLNWIKVLSKNKYGEFVFSSVDELQDFVIIFCQRFYLWDCHTSFLYFLSETNIYSLPGSLLLNLTEQLSKECFGPKKLLKELEQYKKLNQKVLWHGAHANNSHQYIQVMTIHASKGLQFNHVIIGRIDKASRQTKFNACFFSKHPLDLSIWRDDFKRVKSAGYYWATKLQIEQEEEESKRLFYVAVTRAQKSICMISLLESSKISKNSWTNFLLSEINLEDYIHHFVKEVDSDHIKIQATLNKYINNNTIFSQKLFNLIHEWKLSSEKKILGNNAFTEISQDIVTKNISNFKIIPNLSVTSLSHYLICPRKFYYEVVLDLEKDLQYYHWPKTVLSDADDQSFLNANLNSTSKSSIISESINSDFSLLKSSSQRGSAIHLLIQNFWSDKISKNELIDNLANLKIINPEKLVNDWGNYKLQGILKFEQELRFSLHGAMILGSYDVFWQDPDKQLFEVWDFKTGSLDESVRKTYEFQVALYCYALYQLGQVPYDQNILTKIIFLDLDQTIKVKYSFDQLIIMVQDFWATFGSYHIKNLNHCQHCSYTVFCN